MTGDPVDGALAQLGGAPPPTPPMSAELEQAIASTTPVRVRRPGRELAVIAVLGLAHAALFVVVLGIRHDLGELPRLWLSAYLIAWLVGFILALRVGVVPSRGQVTPRAPLALRVAVVASIGFVIAGLALARDSLGAPQAALMATVVDSMIEPPPWWWKTFPCFLLGLATAALPVVLAVGALRGAAPLTSRAIAAAIGAAGGCLGGLMLHVHCPITDRLHLGLAHGSVVAAAALISALVASRWLARR